MDPKFWHDRWHASEIGFHEDAPHSLLQRHWPTRKLAPNAHVVVPLCGKSTDLGWLADLGYQVSGIELSEVAARAYFEHNFVQATVEKSGPFTVYRHDNLQIFVGDFFDATPQIVGAADAVYDRAALIALPPDMRKRYVRHLATLCRPGTRLVLIALEYEPGAINAPPFPVDALEIAASYGDWCDLAVLERSPARVKTIDGTEVCYAMRVRAN